MKVQKVIITIPAYNEEKSIGKVLSGITQVMDSTKYKYALLVVDDGSRDHTRQVALKAGAKVISHQTNLGLAAAFRREVTECLKHDVDAIVHTDADGQYKAEDIPRLLKEIEQGYDLILGSRFKGKIEYMPALKRWGNKAFSKVLSKIVRIPISDGQTGLRAFTKEVGQQIKIISNHTYTQEQIIKAVKQGFRIKEIPVYFARRHGRSRLMSNPFDYAAKAWINIIRIYRDYEPLKFFGILGGIPLVIGLVVGLWLIYLFITTGAVRRIPTAILSVMLVLVGLQIVLFGLLADMKKE